MEKSLYLINPRAGCPGYFGADVFERFGFEPAQGIADLAIPTVAALAPPDWRVCLCDEHTSPINFDAGAAFIGVTGKITQVQRMLEVTAEFRRRGKCVIIGGPSASLSPEIFRGHCDILVVGELEDIAREFFADLERGTWKCEYVAEKPDLRNSPVPRWDLYATGRSLTGCVQTSRGCPFECEFCDVIQYLGRKQRHKSIPQVLAELDVLYQHGFRSVFLADDNFTVYRRRAKDMLAALRDWNSVRPGHKVAFSTQLSIDATRDVELVELCGLAGLTMAFIGIETPNQDSLRETKKRQNIGIDLIEQVKTFLNYGISVTAGMVVGFDHDESDIFEHQYEFAMASPIPLFSLGTLVAPAATPLYARMKSEGRLIRGASEVAGAIFDTNIVPARMKREELMEGTRWLWQQLYHPANFGRRVLRMIECIRPPQGENVVDRNAVGLLRPIEAETSLVIQKLRESGEAERQMINQVLRAMRDKPESRRYVVDTLFRYAQARCVYEPSGFDLRPKK